MEIVGVAAKARAIWCPLLQRHVPHLPGWNRLRYSHRTSSSKRCSMRWLSLLSF